MLLFLFYLTVMIIRILAWLLHNCPIILDERSLYSLKFRDLDNY
jgi:hypothetical protein